MINEIAVFKQAILAYQIQISDEEWERFLPLLTVVHYRKKEVIFSDTEISRDILYIVEGIAASEYQNEGEYVISRFFLSGNLCTNVISAIYETYATDRMIALTPLKGIIIPFKLFMEFYLRSGTIGIFFREKLLQVIVEDKNIISMKTVGDIKTIYTFLQENYPQIIKEIPAKYIAKFIGVTPVGLSRFLSQQLKQKNDQKT